MRDFMQADGQDRAKRAKGFAKFTGLRSQIELNVGRGSVCITPSIARTQTGKSRGSTFHQSFDPPSSRSKNGIDVAGNACEESSGDFRAKTIFVHFNGPDTAILLVGEVVDVGAGGWWSSEERWFFLWLWMWMWWRYGIVAGRVAHGTGRG